MKKSNFGKWEESEREGRKIGKNKICGKVETRGGYFSGKKPEIPELTGSEKMLDISDGLMYYIGVGQGKQKPDGQKGRGEPKTRQRFPNGQSTLKTE